MGDDGLMSQSSFEVNIKEEDYLYLLCPDSHLFASYKPSDDELKKHYTKLLEGVIELRLKCLACWWDVVAMDKGCRPS